MSCEKKASDFEPEIVLTICENSIAPGEDRNLSLTPSGFKVRITLISCSSKVEVDHLLKIIENGADGIELIGCPEDKCKFITGSHKARNRVIYAGKLIEEAGMEAGRIGMTQGENLREKDILKIAEARANAVLDLGRNPMGTEVCRKSITSG